MLLTDFASANLLAFLAKGLSSPPGSVSMSIRRASAVCPPDLTVNAPIATVYSDYSLEVNYLWSELNQTH